MTTANLKFIDEKLEREKQYWLEKLSGDLTRSGLPVDFQRPASISGEKTPFAARIDRDLCEKLLLVTGRNDSLVLTILVTVLKICLHKYAAIEDIIVGTTIHEAYGAVASINKILVLRDRVAPSASARDLLDSVKRTLSDAYSNQKYSFEKILALLEVERPDNRAPLIDIAIILENINRKEHLRNLKNDLTLSFSLKGGQVAGLIEYSPSLFRRQTIEIFWEHYRRILRTVLGSPEVKIDEIEIIAEEKKREFLYEFNRTSTDYPRNKTIARMFEEQVAKDPSAVAVVFDGATLSYRELNDRANRLAHLLIDSGVKSGDVVAILLDHSPDLLAAILGALKAGAAYLPLDPRHPRARRRFILADAEAKLVLTSSLIADQELLSDERTICLDRPWEASGRWSEEEAGVEMSSDEAAYLIYTSGSTGSPKGVVITHRSLVNYISWAVEQYDRGQRLSYGLYSSIGFDLTVTSIFTPLVSGGRVVIYGSADQAEAIRRMVEEGGVEVLKATPSHLRLLEVMDATHSAIKLVIVGGEAFESRLAREVQRKLGAGVEIYNEYGPTEATVGCMIHRYEEERDLGQDVPIGRPGANVKIYVLDERQRVVGENQVGELYIGGECVARGYVNREESFMSLRRRPETMKTRRAMSDKLQFVVDPTMGARREPRQTEVCRTFSEEEEEARFVANPYEAGQRMYRSGDLCRRLSSGELEYVGRRDEQIKHLGHRVELAELRKALNRKEGVRESHVMVRKDGRGREVLVGYYVARQELRAEELREHMREEVMEEVAPRVYVHLKRMPLTVNGKVDVEGLPEIEEREGKGKEKEERAKNGVEEMLSLIWGEVLGIKSVGVRENFFEIGGHSLLATQVISRVREVFGVEIALRQLFERPTIEALGGMIEEELIGGHRRSSPPIVRAKREGGLPLSFAQQRLWFLDLYEPANPLYNIPVAVRLSGRLDIDALHRSLLKVEQRHEALRTVFINDDGRPFQLIRPSRAALLEIKDLTSRSESLREAEAERLAAEEAAQGFDLREGPLVRYRLIKLGAEEHLMLMTMHHIISDGWSMGVLVREVAAMYEAYARGAEPELEELEIQYADYAMWQREWLRGEVLEEELSYWQRQLEGAPAMLELPTDRPRPAAQSYRGASEAISLGAETSERLRELGRREGATPFMSLLAAFDILLYRYSGQDDLVVGAPIANRHRREIEGLIGFFVNTLAMRTEVRGSYREVLKRVRETALGAYAHQYLPFEMLVEKLEPERSLSYSPLFQVMFALQNAPMEKLDLEGLRLEFVNKEILTSKFDLTMDLMGEEETIAGTIEYNTDLFDVETIRRMIGHYRMLIEGIVSNPERRLRDLPLLSEAERRQIIREWNETARDYPRDRCAHYLFERQAAGTPDAIAVVYEEQWVSYGELNRRANRLGRRLRKMGIGAESCVGLCLERSVEMVIGILGILKAGGAYLPLEPEYPRERLFFMLDDIAAETVVTVERWREIFSDHGTRLVSLDSEWEELAVERSENTEIVCGGDNPAYVIYTSGSTGQPKGAIVTHRGLNNHMLWIQDAYPLNQTDRFLQKTPFSFDASVSEFYSPLLVGGQLVMAKPGGHWDPAYLAREMAEREISVIQIVPRLLQALVEEEEWRKCRLLRQVFCGGEALTWEFMEKFLATTDAKLINLYGTTEVTDDSSYWECGPGIRRDLVPIGRPIANTQMYVMDEQHEVIPIGVKGEICIGGAGLGRGYVKRPDLTAARFVPHPHGWEPGQRLYRTGDVGRHLADGSIEYLGRADDQIKIRGYRIELSEIEAVLEQHPSVGRAVVAVHDHRIGEKLLAGYFVSGEDGPSPRELREYLRRWLPEYMIPSVFVRLKELPMTSNGKVNRRALPAPDTAGIDHDRQPVTARTPTEEILTGIWTEVLGAGRIDVENNFFELGGHSLLATRVVSRINGAFGVNLPLRTIFERPTIFGLARSIEEARREERGPGAPPLRRAGRRDSWPLSFAQQRLWFFEQMEPGSNIYNIPAGIRMKGAFNEKALIDTLNEIARRHEALRMRMELRGEEPAQVIDEQFEADYAKVDLTGMEDRREEEARRIAEEEWKRGFDLGGGSLVRYRLIKLAAEEHLILMTMHHIISDGWSMAVLVREVARIYKAYARGTRDELEEPRIQYADYAVWQREWLCGEALEEELNYWKKRLEGAPAALDLATDRPRPALQTFRGARQELLISTELTDSLRNLSHRHAGTLFMTLLAAFKTLLQRYTGQDDVVVGTAVANRSRPETEEVIGYFVNMLVLRTDLSGNPTFTDLLGRVRQKTLEAYEHQDLPFQKLVEALQRERDLSRHPLFQVVFVLQNVPRVEIDLPHLELTMLQAGGDVCHFDLMMEVDEIESGLAVNLEYNVDLFDPSTIKQMLDHYEALLKIIASNPDLRLLDVPLFAGHPDAAAGIESVYSNDQFTF